MPNKAKIDQINKLINDVNTSLSEIKRLLKEVSISDGSSGSVPDSRSIPGAFGKFVGDGMLMEDGSRMDVPLNYASKSQLVYGDKLKTYEENGERKFKQIERVKRLKVEGVLAKKEGKWHVVTADSSYRVLEASVIHFGGIEGDFVNVMLPLDNKFVPFAAIESIVGKEPIDFSHAASTAPVAGVSTPEIKPEVVSEPVTVLVENKQPEPVKEVSVSSVTIKPEVRSEPKPVVTLTQNVSSNSSSKKRKRKKKSGSSGSFTGDKPNFVTPSPVAVKPAISKPLAAPASQPTAPTSLSTAPALSDDDLR